MALKGGGSGSAGAVRAGAAFVELFTKDTALERGLKKAGARLRSWGAGLSKIGLGAIGAASPILGGFAAATNTLGDLTQIKNAGVAFGLAAEEATGFFGVMKAAGSDTRDATEGLVTLGQRVSDALSGTGIEAKQLFDGLGVSASEFAGLNPSEQFFKLHESLLAVADPAKRVQLLLKAVGEDTGKNMINTLSMSTDQLREQAKGFALSEEELKSAKEATMAYSKATASLGQVWNQVAISAAPVIVQLSQELMPLLHTTTEIIKQNRQLIAGLAMGGLAVAALGAALVVVGVGVQAAGMALAGLAAAAAAVKAVLLAIFSPVGLGILAVTAAVGGLAYLFFTQTEAGREMKDSLAGYFGEMKENALSSWKAIENALKNGRLDLAFKVITASLNLEWAKLVLEMTKAWNGFKSTFVDGWHEAVDKVASLIARLGTGVDKATAAAADAARKNLGAEVSSVYALANKYPFLTGMLGFGPVLRMGEHDAALKSGQTIEQIQQGIDQHGNQTLQNLKDQSERDAKEREKARQRDADAALIALTKAKNDADAAKNLANQPHINPLGALVGGVGLVPLALSKRIPTPQQMMGGTSAGAFQGSFRQMLGGQLNDQPQVKEQQKTNYLLESINMYLRNFNTTFPQ